MDEEEYEEILKLAYSKYRNHVYRVKTNTITIRDCLDYWVALEVKNKYNKKDK